MSWFAAKLFLGRAWAWIVAFIQTPLGRLVTVGALVLLVGFFYGNVRYDAGVKHQKAVQAAELVKARAHVAKVEAQSAAISATARADNLAANARIQALTRDLKQKVSAYVTPEADRRCVISNGYVRLREAAGAGVPVVPLGPGGSVDADSGLALSDLAENDIENAAAFHTAVAEVKAWRGWWVAQADLWKKDIKATP